MTRYLVVSYDDDQQQWFYDTVLAEDSDKAAEFICLLRPYVIAADASTDGDFGIRAGGNGKVSLKIKSTDWDASEPLTECQNCEKRWPESGLQPIKDLYQRVEPEEPMPAGECPECGALCHRVEGQS